VDDCSDGVLDPGEDCDEGVANGSDSSCCTSACGLRSAGEACRPAVGSCDAAESCTGSDGACPADGFVADGTACDDADACTSDDECAAGACTGDLEPALCLDPVLCYAAKVTKGTPRFSGVGGIDLADPLASGAVDAKKPRDLCAPASVDGESSPAPDVHAVSYHVRKSPGEAKYVKQFGVAVADGLATLTVDLVKAERMLAPAGLAQGGPAPTPVPGSFDHFRCHRVRTRPGSALPDGVQVAVADELHSRVYDVESPRRLCLAAAKDGTPAVHPAAHLMCYRVALAQGEPPLAPIAGSIHTADALGALRLDLTRADELCLPARLLP
jgi:hypothetical protein